MAGLVDDVFTGSAERSILGLLKAWWGIDCPPAPSDTSHPPILERLWRADAHRLAWGHHDILLSRMQTTLRAAGCVEFYAENQSVWRAGYQPTGDPNPQVVGLVDGSAGVDMFALGIDLHEFLVRTLVIEAVFGAEWWTSGETVQGDAINRRMVRPALDIGQGRFVMPALYSDGKTLCFVFDPDHSNFAFYGAASGDDLASSAFAELGDWSEPEQSIGPCFAPD